jgi:hypothetical protein
VNPTGVHFPAPIIPPQTFQYHLTPHYHQKKALGDVEPFDTGIITRKEWKAALRFGGVRARRVA